MILDKKENLNFYKTLGTGDRYKKAIEWLQSQDLEHLENGRYEIDGNLVYANVMEVTTVPWEEAKYEAHKNYTDIQYIVSGQEVFTYAPADELTETVPYNPEKDVVFFDNSNAGTRMAVKDGGYVIFFPWDGHKPKTMNGAPEHVKKIVVKVCEN